LPIADFPVLQGQTRHIIPAIIGNPIGNRQSAIGNKFNWQLAINLTLAFPELRR